MSLWGFYFVIYFIDQVELYKVVSVQQFFYGVFKVWYYFGLIILFMVNGKIDKCVLWELVIVVNLGFQWIILFVEVGFLVLSIIDVEKVFVLSSISLVIDEKFDFVVFILFKKGFYGWCWLCYCGLLVYCKFFGIIFVVNVIVFVVMFWKS